LPVLVLCADCGAVIEVRPTKSRVVHSVIWSYCKNCARKRALAARREKAQRMIQLAFPA